MFIIIPIMFSLNFTRYSHILRDIFSKRQLITIFISSILNNNYKVLVLLILKNTHNNQPFKKKNLIIF
jgi:hypothetical protein